MIKRNKTVITIYVIFVVLSMQSILISNGQTSESSSETFESFIQNVLKSHESLVLAKLNIIKTKSEIQIIESKLGWNLFANAGINRYSSFAGSLSTLSSASLGVNKLFESGDSIELTSKYNRDDSEFAVSIFQPNPLSTTGVDLNYRMPLIRNKNYNEYQLNINSANSRYTESINSQLTIRDQVTTQAIDLFYDAAILVARIETAKKSINRSVKLKNHIKKNIQLGLLEKGEISQAEAQIYNLQAQHEELVLIWEKSKIAINRLIGQPWNNAFATKVTETPIIKYNLVETNEIVKNYNPELKSLYLDLELADSKIALDLDNTKSKLDLVFSIGALNTQGPSVVSTVDESDVVGGVKLEFQKALDNRGFNSKLYQSRVERDSIQTQITKLELDLKYDTYTLISDIKHITRINDNYKKRNEAEKLKFKDIVNRYRAGRAETNLVIQFENELTQAELIYKTQKLLREKAISLLKLKQGKLLNNKVEN